MGFSVIRQYPSIRYRQNYHKTWSKHGKREQALAALFFRRLPAGDRLDPAVPRRSWRGRRGRVQQWIFQRLLFGRFLNFSTSVEKLGNLPKNLTEGRFRGYWAQTDKSGNERGRFVHVLELIKGRCGGPAAVSLFSNPDKTTKLLAALKTAVPFEVELTEWLVKQLRAQHHAGAAQKHHTVSDLCWRPRWHRVPYRAAGKTRSTRCLPDPGPRTTCHAACRSHCRLSEASSEKTQEARTALLTTPPFIREEPQ
jgi:hypothetical protein